MKHIRKVLIANRGEISVRIMRTCREMGVQTVAVFSEVDRCSPHVMVADEAYCIGPAPAAESYLDVQKILDVARRSGADAVHPGYGFLAENAAFARAVPDAGLIFIGPSPETIELMGSKTASRQSMIAAKVPVVPGAQSAIKSVEEAEEIIDRIGGYPVLIKAAAGGGGKGMRTVFKAADLTRAFQAARGEALKAFGDDTIYVEKFIDSPKHIEMQVIADQHGNIVHLWERDCSIQRRHQKVIEECPSAVLTPAKRAEMGAVAVEAARACNYVNAGTVEFLYDQSGDFYFLEMNTRLQVEHPVTEMVMGVDLVRMQLEVADGQKLSVTQDSLIPRGHALECRINAEDVFNGFVPATGKITRLRYPEGPGVRVDGGIVETSEISRFYDPLAAKLIVWAENRSAAIERMKRALLEFEIEGLLTTIPFCLAVLNHPEFCDATFTTKFVEKHWETMKSTLETDEQLLTLLAAAVAFNTDEKGPGGVPEATAKDGGASKLSSWKARSLMERRQ